MMEFVGYVGSAAEFICCQTRLDTGLVAADIIELAAIASFYAMK
jgi:hypothetical protein